MNSDTHFAPASRTGHDEIIDKNQFIISQKLFKELFDSMAGISAILDSNRQIVYSNNEFLNLLGLESIEDILGKRPGEVVACIHSAEEPSGCGTAEACVYCGAVNAILESQKTGRKSVRETRITTTVNGKMTSLDMNIASVPVTLSGETFYILTLQDISDVKRRAALERIFFHDLLNSAGGLNGLLNLLKEGVNPEEEKEIINLSEEASRDIMEEIILHRQIKAAENGDLQVKIETINSHEFLISSVNKISSHSVAKNKNIHFDSAGTGFSIETDRLLLQRVIINLLKNALEATTENGTVTLGEEDRNEKVIFWVKNDELIPDWIQAQLFQRSFSTKGSDRGIGTYSIKLLVENYLKGKVSFVSNEHDRTVFSVELHKKWPD